MSEREKLALDFYSLVYNECECVGAIGELLFYLVGSILKETQTIITEPEERKLLTFLPKEHKTWQYILVERD